LTSLDCEGGSSVFRVTTTDSKPLFDRPTFLSVSTQLYQEALSSALGRVFTLAPAFRAERSLTSRHLTEFWMLEAEVSWVDELEQVMGVVEACVRAAQVAGTQSRDLKLLRPDFQPSMAPWPRITYTDVLPILQQAGFAVQWGDDLRTEQERFLAEQHFRSPVFVTDYPASLKPFYMRLNADQRTVACFDLLVPSIGELAGGSLREERAGPLKDAMAAKGLDAADYGWYMDLRRFGSVPHGGFGLGWERLIAYLTGVENVRECVAFPRSSEGWAV
jgi:asparaginyl-tRNA synthetase